MDKKKLEEMRQDYLRTANHNKEVKERRDIEKRMGFKNVNNDSGLLNYQLHTKLMESYILEYQLLKAENERLEEKIRKKKLNNEQ